MKQVARTPILPGIKILPLNYEVLEINYTTVEVRRPDGFIVFFDRRKDPCSTLLNRIRLALPPETVIRLVGTIRGYQASITYASKYQKSALHQQKQQLKQFVHCMNQALELGFDAHKFLQEEPKTIKAA
ncbi:hypothetical protein [Turneriella parva]|uniref:Uncharacterized protein n=1 Tax=Turneriella parva (strain ATCC BAA-1111 / DSM 21527 / NCTC 11395 / H) TaxID=869212 RepID=I4BAB5_TURPD|nr:hypothetical protein [Turneriella parva]AFM14222.1 hypothetical protein Turpa_3588 [Turneriella parva DSM 21527]